MKTKTYPALKKADYPNGIKCGITGCPNLIKPGQPYDEVTLDTSESVYTVNIVCVYH